VEQELLTLPEHLSSPPALQISNNKNNSKYLTDVVLIYWKHTHKNNYAGWISMDFISKIKLK
jgi:hypothetical protein